VNIGPVEPGAVHVWRAVVDCRPAALEALARTLDAAETARTDRFRFDRHRRRHVFRRGMLRILLGHYLDADPARLAFEVNAYGKPALAGTTSGQTMFNLSHSGDIVVIAITAGRDLGVDVEAIRPISDADAIARRHFAPAERARLATAAARDRDQAFLRLWTRKEAYVKAVGGGLSIPLDSFDVSAPDSCVRSGGTEWSLIDLPLPDGYVGAVAIRDGAVPIACREWRPDA
jgi:4'-phosphopantetheinyl transferase